MSSNALPLRCLLAASLLAAAPAAAQGVDVEALLRQGVALRREGRDADAVALFEQAHRASGSPRTAAQLGLAQQALGRWLPAEALLRTALAAADDPWVARNRASLEGVYRVTLQHVAEVEVSADVAGAELRVDGALVGALPLREPLRLLAGTVSLEVRAPGGAAVTRRVAVEPGQRLREHFELAAAPAASAQPAAAIATPPAPTPTPNAAVAVDEGASRRAPHDAAAPGWTRPLGVGLGAVAGASLAAGVVALALRQSAASAYNADCAPGVNTGSCGEHLETGRDLGVAAAVTLSLAGGLAVASVVLLALPPRPSPTRRAVRLTPWVVGVAGGGVALSF